MTVNENWSDFQTFRASDENAVAHQVNVNTTAIAALPYIWVDAAPYNGNLAIARVALGTNPGTLVLGGRTYALSSSLTPIGVGQSIIGNGLGSTLINYTGTGDCIRVQDTRAWIDPAHYLPGSTGGPGYGGILRGFTINGTGAGASATGLHIGDITGIEVSDVAVINFTGASAIGVWLDNRVTWTEGGTFDIRVENCTNPVIFDVNGGFNSFGYGIYRFFIEAYANQNGVQFRNGAYVYNLKEKFSIGGGFLAGVTNTGTVLKISDTASFHGGIAVNAECNGASGVGHTAITVASTAEFRFSSGSELNFINAAVSFQDGTWIGSQTTGAGLVNVDSTNRMDTHQAFRAIGGINGIQGYLDPAGAWYLGGGNWFKAQMTAGAQTIVPTFAGVTGLTGQAAEFDLFIQQPASGSTTLTWPGSFVWLDGASPVLSKVVNAIDWIHIATADYATFYAKHMNAPGNSLVVRFNPATLVAGGLNEYLGSSPQTGTLPAVSATSGETVIVKNLSTATVTVNAAGADNIYYDSSPKTTLSVPPGGSLVMVNDGFEWAVIDSVVPRPRVNSVASSATPAINTDTTDQFNITALAAAITSMTSGLTGAPSDGQLLDIRFKDNGTARAITWGASFTGTLLSTTVTSKTHLQRLKYDAAAAKWAGYLADTTGY